MEGFILFLKSSITIMIPVFFASIGGMFPALAGTLNIALEGLLLAGAFSSLTIFSLTGSIAASVICAVISAVILCALQAFSVFKLRADMFITGLAVNLLSGGLCAILSEKIFNTKGVVALDFLNENTLKTSMLFNLFIILGLMLLLVSWVIIYKTPFGYRLRACNNDRDALVSLGIKPQFYITTAVLISGFFCGLGGSFLSLNLGAYVPGMSAGKGWIALAVIFLGLKKPFGILAASFVFASAEAYSNYAQGFWNIPADFMLAFPYICSLIALIAVSFIPKKPVL